MSRWFDLPLITSREFLNGSNIDKPDEASNIRHWNFKPHVGIPIWSR
jgi:hypothetical protein